MVAQTAKEAHQLANNIQAARLAGDHATADRLIAEFNARLFGPSADSSSNSVVNNQTQSAPVMQPSQASSANNVDAELNQLQARYQQLLSQKQSASSPQINNAPASSAQPPHNLPTDNSLPDLPSLAEAVKAEQQAAQQSVQPDIDNVPPASALGSNNQADFNTPIPSLADSSQVNQPPKPLEFSDLIANYHEGVQPLLKQYLSEFSTELEIPEVVLGPTLLREFETLWRTRQSEEPLLLKLPDHIQQRSVLLRYRDNLLEILK